MADLQGIVRRAEAGEAEAQFQLGTVHHAALLGQQRDLALAARSYEQAALQGHVSAMVNLGVLLVRDRPAAGGERDAAGAAAWFRRAAEAGDAQAAFYLAGLLVEGDGVPADPAGAVSWYERAASAGSAQATRALGAMHLQGRHVPADPIRGQGLLAQAADAGDREAAYLLGSVLTNGQGGEPPDAKGGLRWFERAAAGGHAQAQFECGQAYRLGRGCEAMPTRALDFYHAGAQQDHADCQYSLALMVADGIGLDRPRPDLAEPWYQRAAFAGHAGAAHNLGVLFAKGHGVAQDAEMAQALFEHAIGLGNDDALFSLGLLHLHANNVQDAALWALVSMRAQPEGAGQRLLDAVSEALTEEQLAEARARAAAWVREDKPLAFLVTGGD